MANGIVKWFDKAKGYGFIRPNDGAQDIFVHITAVEKSGLHNLTEGQKVSYEAATDNRGKTSAANIKLIVDAS